MPINYLPLSTVIERVKGVHIAGAPNVNESQMAEWTWDCLDMIGAVELYSNIEVVLDIVDGSAKLPRAIRAIQTITNENGCILLPMNSFLNETNFKVESGRIYTAVDGKLTLNYSGIAVDEDGYPRIPDYTEFLNAVEYFIIYKILNLGVLGRSVDMNVMLYYTREAAMMMESARRVCKMNTKNSLRMMKAVWSLPIVNANI